MPNHNGQALQRLLRESDALEVSGNREIQRLNRRDQQIARSDLAIATAQGDELALEASRFSVSHGPGDAGTWNSLDPALQPDYEVFDYLRWSLWQQADEYWPVPVEVLPTLKLKVKSPNAAGKHGSRHVNQGKKNTEVMIKCQLWTTIHFACYTKLCQLYGKNREISKSGDAVRILHPNTIRCAIKEIIIVEIGPPTHKKDQLWEAEIKAREFIQDTQRARSGPSRTATIQAPPGQEGIDRQGERNRAPQPNQSRPAAEPLMSVQGQPDAGIPASVPPGS